MPQIFRPVADTITRIVLIALLLSPFVVGAGSYALMNSQYVTRQSITPKQPVPFSHEHHVGGLGIDCRYCHTSVETSAFAGLPPTRTCMTCHSQLYTNAAMLAPVRQSLAEASRSAGLASTSCPITSISIIRSMSPTASAAPPATAGCRRCR
jgi:hypothetical protein